MSATRDDLIMRWHAAKQRLDAAKKEEMELRNQVVAMCYADAQEGTHNLDLGSGYKLKAVVKNNYTLADNEAVDAALSKLRKVGNEGEFLADRVIGWTPKLSLSEYRELQPQYKAVIDTVLTIKPGAPSLELVEPKGK
jgi:hypothetical protein